jgi:cation diffusion facilitator CzcD-associated flavoprotein CzcO
VVGRVLKRDGLFTISDDQERPIGHARHVIFAVGHGHVVAPRPLAEFRETHGFDPRVVHAYEEKQYAPPRTVLVVGDGLTAGTEWVSILETGGTVIALSRTGFSIGQPLNTPRRYFSRRGIAPYRRQPEEGRRAELQQATRGTIPAYPAWMRLFHRALRKGRLERVRGELISIEETDMGALRCTLRLPDGHALRTVVVHQVVAATGFQPVVTHPLLAQLVADYHLPTVDGILKVRDDFCIDELSTPTSVAAVIGPAAAWALPSADSLGGMKIVAHHIATLLLGPESWHPRDLFQKTVRWATLVAGKEIA